MKPRSAPARPGRTLALAAQVHAAKPERPHPNCKCEIEPRELTAQEARDLQGEFAHQAEPARVERIRRESEKQAARNYVDARDWNKDGDRIRISGKDRKGVRNPVTPLFCGAGR